MTDAKTVHPLKAHSLRRPPGLIECAHVWDVGAGLRPMQWYAPARHVCIEPYFPYAQRLQEAGYVVRNETALAALLYLHRRPHIPRPHAIYLLDVIEHMEREEGEEVRWLVTQIATVQVVVFTPHGFLPQTHDAWKLGGEYWQTHRSGWTPEAFPGWTIQRRVSGAPKGFFAVWTTTP